MKRIITILGIGIMLIGLISYSVIYIRIGKDVKKNIKLAEEIYEIKGQDAVIAFLKDESN